MIKLSFLTFFLRADGEFFEVYSLCYWRLVYSSGACTFDASGLWGPKFSNCSTRSIPGRNVAMVRSLFTGLHHTNSFDT